jgi:predicted dehydrogenase
MLSGGAARPAVSARTRAEGIIMAGFHDITAAIVGAGFIGPVHVEGLRRLGIRVKGIAGISLDEAERAAATLGLERAYASVDDLLSDPDVGSVHLASPNRLHHDHVMAALAAGKHVICEKPLAMTSAQTAALVAASKARPGQMAAVNYNLRFYPLSLQARALVRSGTLGDVLHVHGSYVQDWLLYPTDFNWRVLRSEGGELRAVGDIGTHWLDLVAFVTGLEVEAVMADLMTVHQTRLRPPSGSVETFSGKQSQPPTDREPVAIDTEDFGAILLRFKGGARGALTVSQVTAGRKNCLRYELAGAKKALYFNSEAPNRLWIGERAEANRELMRDPSLLDPEAARFASYPGGHNEGFPDTFKQVYRAVYTDVLNGARSADALYATFEDGHQEVRVCEAIAKSHRERRWVTVGE